MFTALLINLTCALIAGVVAAAFSGFGLENRTNSFGPGGPTKEDLNRIEN